MSERYVEMDMSPENFEKQLRRHEALNELTAEFSLCLCGFNYPELIPKAQVTAIRLIKEKGTAVMDGSGKKELTVGVPISLDWIIDTAISLGYNNLERDKISTGVFSSVPGITIGNMLAKQKFGVKANKDNTYTLIYTAGSFANDQKLIKALLEGIVMWLVSERA